MYGCLYYTGTMAMMLEYLGGVSLSLPEGAWLRPEELSTQLQSRYRALHGFVYTMTTLTSPTFCFWRGELWIWFLRAPCLACLLMIRRGKNRLLGEEHPFHTEFEQQPGLSQRCSEVDAELPSSPAASTRLSVR